MQELVRLGRSVLVTAYTNTAVDNILLKLVEAGMHNFLRLGRPDAVHPDIRPYVQGGARNQYADAPGLRRLVRTVPVIGATCLGAARFPLLKRRLLDVCILDEASQVTLPVSLAPILRARIFALVWLPAELVFLYPKLTMYRYTLI